MRNKAFVLCFIFVLFFSMIGCSNKNINPVADTPFNGIVPAESNSTTDGDNFDREPSGNESLENAEDKNEEETRIETVYLSVNNIKLSIKIVDNEATRELVTRLKYQSISLDLHDYGDFEKTGPLGFSLPTSDEYMNVDTCDVVLYLGRNICVYYDTNSWSFTPLGKIEGVSKIDLKNILGTGNVSMLLSID